MLFLFYIYTLKVHADLLNFTHCQFCFFRFLFFFQSEAVRIIYFSAKQNWFLPLFFASNCPHEVTVRILPGQNYIKNKHQGLDNSKKKGKEKRIDRRVSSLQQPMWFFMSSHPHGVWRKRGERDSCHSSCTLVSKMRAWVSSSHP